MASCFPRSARSTSFLASFNFLGAQYKIGATSGATSGQPQDEMIRNAKKRIERAEMQDWQWFQEMDLFQPVSAKFNKWL